MAQPWHKGADIFSGFTFHFQYTLPPRMFRVGCFLLETTIIIKIEFHPFYSLICAWFRWGWSKKKNSKWPTQKKLRFSKPPILNIFWPTFLGLVLGFVLIFFFNSIFMIVVVSSQKQTTPNILGGSVISPNTSATLNLLNIRYLAQFIVHHLSSLRLPEKGLGLIVCCVSYVKYYSKTYKYQTSGIA